MTRLPTMTRLPMSCLPTSTAATYRRASGRWRWLCFIETPAEAREHENKAEAVAQYMRREGVGLEAQNKAAEYKLRAMRRGGQLLEDMGVKRGGGLKPRDVALVDLGIEKARSRRWYNITRIPSDCLCPVCQRPPPQPLDRPAGDGGGDVAA